MTTQTVIDAMSAVLSIRKLEAAERQKLRELTDAYDRTLAEQRAACMRQAERLDTMESLLCTAEEYLADARNTSDTLDRMAAEEQWVDAETGKPI